jgi:hypothetical protein
MRPGAPENAESRDRSKKAQEAEYDRGKPPPTWHERTTGTRRQAVTVCRR